MVINMWNCGDAVVWVLVTTQSDNTHHSIKLAFWATVDVTTIK